MLSRCHPWPRGEGRKAVGQLSQADLLRQEASCLRLIRGHWHLWAPKAQEASGRRPLMQQSLHTAIPWPRLPLRNFPHSSLLQELRQAVIMFWAPVPADREGATSGASEPHGHFGWRLGHSPTDVNL
ncbi:hypothetical protein NDU88_004852 [Pleurodeles waltl]|uniref:Uncharacterized protein n=1 Tax=Pleurodeles waltl TaxID=8319 RepID=A0AAV7RLP3_PLEWA|nr:hypothetical protein NDU88_004852 [Pleurodeles waltl]